MLSRLLLNLVLLLLVASLAWFTWKNYQTEEHASQPVRIAYLEADRVDRIFIRHKQRFIELVKQADGWRMKTPIDIRANDFRVRTLLRMLDSSSHADYDADELDLGRYGLAHPQTRIRFNDLSIAFGIRNPVNGYRYVLVEDRVHLVEDSFYPLLSSQLGALIALELLPADVRITWMQLPETELIQDENGTWSSDAGLTADEINETVSAWKNTQAFGVHDFMPRDELGYVSVLVDGRLQPIEFIVTDTDPWLIIARPELGLEYHFNIEHYDTLLRPGADGDLATEVPADMRQEILEALEQMPADDPVAPETQHDDERNETEAPDDLIYLRDPGASAETGDPADPSGSQTAPREDPW